VCGDGVVGPGEACDDADEDDDDECTSACKAMTCGDGVVQVGEQCDDGPANDNTGACTLTCLVSSCGDGFVQAGEACDDGDDDDADACRSDCQAATCGDGVQWAGHEQCDDGNNVDGDGCSDDCTVPKRVFVTAIGYTGNLGGFAGAKAKCQARADAADLGGVWDAYVRTTGSNPSTRFTHSATGYQRLDGAIVADDWDDLVDSSIDAPINLNEFGGQVGNERVWTGVGLDNLALYSRCGDWTQDGPGAEGWTGRTWSITSAWHYDSYETLPCNELRRLYCFEQ
jgi:cysteine-rich repeat protein